MPQRSRLDKQHLLSPVRQHRSQVQCHGRRANTRPPRSPRPAATHHPHVPPAPALDRPTPATYLPDPSYQSIRPANPIPNDYASLLSLRPLASSPQSPTTAPPSRHDRRYLNVIRHVLPVSQIATHRQWHSSAQAKLGALSCELHRASVSTISSRPHVRKLLRRIDQDFWHQPALLSTRCTSSGSASAQASTLAS